MKFTKPINREVEVDGTSYILALDETGVEFRLKGKRKSTRVEWTQVLQLAEGGQGAGTRSAAGAGASPQGGGSYTEETRDRMQQVFQPQDSRGVEAGEGGGTEDRSRTATASERGQEG